MFVVVDGNGLSKFDHKQFDLFGTVQVQFHDGLHKFMEERRPFGFVDVGPFEQMFFDGFAPLKFFGWVGGGLGLGKKLFHVVSQGNVDFHRGGIHLAASFLVVFRRQGSWDGVGSRGERG